MDQQFRLKWNNHCNTLLQVFGNLLKTETLVDCTIGADGQYLKAHKVVVSACSPYFQSLFTEHFDKHPIIILKDIKFTELQSMIDYMYEGEVNISQDQLPSFLKAAASIQLKGLTQNSNKSEGPPPPPQNMMDSKPMPQLNTPRMLTNGLTPQSMLNVEMDEGSQSRKKRKVEHPPSSASSSPSLVPDVVVPNVILDVPGENNGNCTPGTPGQNGATGNNENNGGSGAMKKEPSEYSGRSEDEEEDGMSHDGWGGDLSNDGLQDSNSTMSAGDRSALGHTPGGNRSAGGPGALSVTGGQQDMSNVDENNQENIENQVNTSPSEQRHQPDKDNLVQHNLFQMVFEQQVQQQLTATSLNKLKSSGDENGIRNDFINDAAMAISQRYLERIVGNGGTGPNNNNNPLQSIAAAQLAHAQNILLQDYYESGSDTSEYNTSQNSGAVKQRRSRSVRDKDAMILPCDGCGKKYRSKTSLSLHKRLECGKEPAFKCPHCPLKTHQKGNLQVHMKKKHNQDYYTGIVNLSTSAIFHADGNETAASLCIPSPPKITS